MENVIIVRTDLKGGTSEVAQTFRVTGEIHPDDVSNVFDEYDLDKPSGWYTMGRAADTLLMLNEVGDVMVFRAIPEAEAKAL